MEHPSRGKGTVDHFNGDGKAVVTFDSGETHKYGPSSQSKLTPLFRVGMRVLHEKHGPGGIPDFLPGGRITVEFDNGEELHKHPGAFLRRVPRLDLAQRLAALLLELYGDEWLLIPAMHYRWTYNEDWAYGEFGALSAPQLSPEEQYDLGKKNGARFKGALPVLGVSEATIPGIEKSYEAFLADLSRHLEAHPFLLGGRPSLADFAFYGPLYAHLYRDPESGKLMKRLAPKVADWVERMQAGGTGGGGDLLADDVIPETLKPILSRLMREALPAVSHLQTGTRGTGLGNVYGNKGGAAVAFHFYDTSICLINTHLAARPERINERNMDCKPRARHGPPLPARTRHAAAICTDHARGHVPRRGICSDRRRLLHQSERCRHLAAHRPRDRRLAEEVQGAQLRASQRPPRRWRVDRPCSQLHARSRRRRVRRVTRRSCVAPTPREVTPCACTLQLRLRRDERDQTN